MNSEELVLQYRILLITLNLGMYLEVPADFIVGFGKDVMLEQSKFGANIKGNKDQLIVDMEELSYDSNEINF